jgi:hypothetical protein
MAAPDGSEREAGRDYGPQVSPWQVIAASASQVWWAQHGCPVSPHGTHMPCPQPRPAVVQVSPPQHDSPAPPHGHTPFKH